MQKKRFEILSSILVLLLILTFVLLCRKNRPISESSVYMNSYATGDVVYGASALGFTYSVSDYGIFYLKDTKMQYYDLEAKDSYMLCGKANCHHSNSNCSARYENMGDVTGLAMYGENVYAIKLNQESNTYDLFTMEPSGNNQKILYSLDIGNYVPGSWVLNGIGDVYYAGGMAWFTTHYQYIGEPMQDNSELEQLQSTVVLGINLKDGKATALNELPKEGTRYESKNNAAYEFEFISKDYVLISKSWNNLEQMTKNEFQKAYDQGEFEKFDSNVDPYYEYITSWYEENKEPMFQYLLYNMHTGKLTELENGKRSPDYGGDGQIAGYYLPYIFIDTYEGQLLYQNLNYESPDTSIYLLDIATDEKKLVLEIKNGSTLLTSNPGSVSPSLIDGEKLLYCLYREDEKVDICYYDMNSKEHTKLFQDDRAITFRMIGETAEKYIGVIYNFILEQPVVHMIDKEEYYKGNLEAAEKLF